MLLVALLGVLSAAAQPQGETVVLWPDGAPGAVGDTGADRPTLSVFLPAPERATGTAVVVCPGGGYVMHAMEHEGRQVAQWLNRLGVAAFVLTYRLGPRYRHPAPLQDAQRALRYVRLHAGRFGVDPGRVGIWGFSAGGHLAATAATHVAQGDPQAEAPIDRLSSRPDFVILAYPVISMVEPYAHAWSRKMLLGDEPDPELMADLSNERQVTADTPPAFLFHTDEDDGVPPQNSIAFYLALRAAGVPAELHIYERGPHGVGLAPYDPVLSTWTDRLADWMRGRGLLPVER